MLDAMPHANPNPNPNPKGSIDFKIPVRRSERRRRSGPLTDNDLPKP